MGGSNSFLDKAVGWETTFGAFNPSGHGGWLQGKGGGGGGGGVDPNQQWMTFLAAQQAQNIAAQNQALQSEQQAIVAAQRNAARSAETEGEQRAQQQLGLQNAYQQAQDATALSNMKTATANSPTGGAFNFPAHQSSQLSNLGAGAGQLPPTAANMAGSQQPTMNPALANLGTRSPNQIAAPAVGKTLGGM